jgi:hypothetical protein
VCLVFLSASVTHKIKETNMTMVSLEEKDISGSNVNASVRKVIHSLSILQRKVMMA